MNTVQDLKWIDKVAKVLEGVAIVGTAFIPGVGEAVDAALSKPSP